MRHDEQANWFPRHLRYRGDHLLSVAIRYSAVDNDHPIAADDKSGVADVAGVFPGQRPEVTDEDIDVGRYALWRQRRKDRGARDTHGDAQQDTRDETRDHIQQGGETTRAQGSIRQLLFA